MKLIIAGSRTFTDYQHLAQELAPDRHRITQVITGGARGADQLGYRWAWKHQVKHQLFRAEWERFGKSAGVRRNHQMAQAGDVLVAFQSIIVPAHVIWSSACRRLASPWWSSARMARHKKSAGHVASLPSRASASREDATALHQPP